MGLAEILRGLAEKDLNIHLEKEGRWGWLYTIRHDSLGFSRESSGNLNTMDEITAQLAGVLAEIDPWLEEMRLLLERGR